MTVALLGVFVMQLYYIEEAYNLKSQLFDQQVNQALNAVVNKVQKRNAFYHLNKKDVEIRKRRENDVRRNTLDLVEYKEQFKQKQALLNEQRQRIIIDSLNKQDYIIRTKFFNPTIISEVEYISMTNPMNNSGLHLEIKDDVDAEGRIVKRTILPSFKTAKGKAFSLVPGGIPDTIRYLVVDPSRRGPLVISLPRISSDLETQFKKEDEIEMRNYTLGLNRFKSRFNADSIQSENLSRSLIEDVAQEIRHVNIPLSQRISAETLDTLLKAELLNHNITQRYNFRVSLANKDSLVYIKALNSSDKFQPKNTFKITLFSNDLLRDPGMLYVSFPTKNSAILTNLGATLASSIGLLLVLISIFAYTLYAILRQKKISEMKTDFINNMTHEFKTPVATIMIASEALKDQEMLDDKNRIHRLANIIYDENVRLGNHIERVLNIARLEKNELKLDQAEVCMNDLIAAVIDSMSLQLQKRNAHVNLQLNATNATVLGDELHLSNLLYNLVDNAIKYSKDEPEITIATKNLGKNLIIDVADKGIGITKEQSKRIFDQFYRVPTGNLHDVKGFGLGLNYVYDIVKKMNGSIKVNSEKDKGTNFEIILPVTKI